MPLDDKWTRIFPERTSTIENLNTRLVSVLDKLKSQINPAGPPIIPKITFMLEQYIQLSLHRIYDLAEETCLAWNRETPSAAFLLCRAAIENIAALYTLELRLSELVNKRELAEIYNTIVERIFWSRSVDRLPRATSILTLIKKVDRDHTGFQNVYDTLSEFCHPNYSAMLGVYGKPNKKKVSVDLDKAIGVNEKTFVLVFNALLPALNILLTSLSKLESLYPDLSAMSDDDLKKQGIIIDQ